MSITTKEVANGLVALCREGKFMDAVVAYYGNDIVSVEAMAMGEHMPREVSGLENIKAKDEWWEANHEVHSVEASDPALSGDEFIGSKTEKSCASSFSTLANTLFCIPNSFL
jgi:hypothetical protein